MEQNNLQYPFELFGIECGDGWKQLYEPLIDWIVEYNKTHDDKIVIEQIKEKYAGLRFYIDHGPKELYNLIDKAEEESYKICEFCGTKENVGLVIQGWYTTICLTCLQKNLKNMYPHVRKWKRLSDGKIFIVATDKVENIEDYENQENANIRD